MNPYQAFANSIVVLSVLLGNVFTSSVSSRAVAYSPFLTLDISGEWKYQDRALAQKNLRNAIVEIWQVGAGLAGTDLYLGQTKTDASGKYQLTVSTSPFFSTAYVYSKVYPKDNYAVRVVNNIFLDDDARSFSERSPPLLATTNSAIVFSPRVITSENAAAYYMFDLIANKAGGYLVSNVGWVNNYDIRLVWNQTNTISYYQLGRIYIKPSDEWDPDVVLHEYGHFVMDKVYYKYPDIPNCQPHSWASSSSTGCAWTEGWATFLQAVLQQGDPDYDEYVDRNDDGSINFSFKLEPPFPLASGVLQEGAVAASLWDIYDPGNEAWDTLDLGFNGRIFNGIWNLFKYRTPQNVNLFECGWLLSQNGSNNQVMTIFSHHGINNTTANCSVVYIPSVIK